MSGPFNKWGPPSRTDSNANGFKLLGCLLGFMMVAGFLAGGLFASLVAYLALK